MLAGSPQSQSAQVRRVNEDRLYGEEKGSGSPSTHSQFQFSNGSNSLVGYQFRGGTSGDNGACNSDHGWFQQDIEAGMEAQPTSTGEESEGGRVVSPRAGVGGSEEAMVGVYGGSVEGGRDNRTELGVDTPNSINGVSNHETANREDATVDILIDSDHGLWRVDLVRELFLNFEAENILSIPLSTCMPPDKLVWAAMPNGTFTVKSAYWIAMDMKEAEQEGTSGLCGSLVIYWVDCHCTFADVVWKLSCDVGSLAISLAHFMAIAWNIWRNRNRIRHGEEPKKKENLILEASRFISEFQAVQDPPIPSAYRSQTSWLPPKPSVYKANVDGAVFKNLSSAGMGVLIRDDKAKMVWKDGIERLWSEEAAAAARLRRNTA
nr:hypothetical protein CFP56_18795 [Quercus suber]